jgi:hypothetical protein
MSVNSSDEKVWVGFGVGEGACRTCRFVVVSQSVYGVGIKIMCNNHIEMLSAYLVCVSSIMFLFLMNTEKNIKVEVAAEGGFNSPRSFSRVVGLHFDGDGVERFQCSHCVAFFKWISLFVPPMRVFHSCSSC